MGAGIALTDALPVSDSVGKAYSTEGKVFDFSIEATNTGTGVIPYEVTLRKKSDSTLVEEAVKVYLTDMTEEADSELLAPTLYSNLIQTEVEVGSEVEKTIYTDNVTGNTENYTKNFRLRMWVDEAVDFSNDLYTGKTFTAMVNVYSNVPLVSEEEISLRGNANISSVAVYDTELTAVEGQDYDYETTLPEGTTEIALNVETENKNSTVTIEKVDSLAYNSNSIERIAVSKIISLTDGDNYFKVTITSQNKEVTKEYMVKVFVGTLSEAIFSRYKTIYENPTLTSSSNNVSDASGLYKSVATNDGSPTYYYRGNVENNYVSFAGQTWRIVRINEDGTIRLILQEGINNNTAYSYNSVYSNYTHMYYSNGIAKNELSSWYTTNIASNDDYSSKVVSGNYYCEQARVKFDSNYTSGNASMVVYTSYTPNFKCATDGNGKGIISSNIGLITYDEVVHAGGYYGNSNSSFYLYNGVSLNWWTMTPGGVTLTSSRTGIWTVELAGYPYYNYVISSFALRPVINIKADVNVTGTGISTNPYKVI